MVARWNAMGEWLDRRAGRLRRSAANGRIGVRATMEKVVDQLTSSLAHADDDTPLLAALPVAHDDWDPGDVERLRCGPARRCPRCRPAGAGAIPGRHPRRDPADRPAPTSQPGLMPRPGWRETYERPDRRHTSLVSTADEIHAIGLAEVARIDAETARARRARPRDLGPRRDPAPAARRSGAALRDARRGRGDGRRVARPRERGRPGLVRASCPRRRAWSCTMRRARGEALDDRLLPPARDRRLAAGPVLHQHVGARDPPALRGRGARLPRGRPGPPPADRDRARSSTDLPAFRRHLGPTAFVEGWGLYTERLADEMGLYSGDLDRIGMLSFDAWRACRLVVDTGMHALGWTRQQAIDFMLEHTRRSPRTTS